jgi:c-di-AMP phosphodiesterase-like protein
MDILISMKAETIQKGLYMNCNIMQMPTAQAKPYFIMELREDNEVKLKLIKQYAEILQEKFDKDEEFLIEHTNIGIILKKRVDEGVEYMEAWDNWVLFSRKVYEELAEIVGE